MRATPVQVRLLQHGQLRGYTRGNDGFLEYDSYRIEGLTA